MSRLDGTRATQRDGVSRDGVSVVRAVADAMATVDTRSCM
jgi:hypothetical protein